MCPTCEGTGKYKFNGEEHDCPVDWYGHVQMRLFKLYRLHNIPSTYMDLDWEEYPYPTVKDAVENYIENYRSVRRYGMGLELFGHRLGAGKTWTAIHVQKEIAKQGFATWFTDFYSLTHARENDPVMRQRLLNSELLIIDEVYPPVSEAHRLVMADRFEDVVRQRTNANFPTIITTNMSTEALDEHFPRVYSLLSAKQWRIEINGKDYRREGAFARNEDLALIGERRPIT